jgi:hypothetical protein
VTTLGGIKQHAYDWFANLMSRTAATTHEGMLKALAMVAQARPRKVKLRGNMIALVHHRLPKRNGVPKVVDVPIFYLPPPPTRLNRSRHLPAAHTYAEARAISRGVFA